MFRNYLKIIIRNLLKFKSYSFINILGLAIGLASTILIFLWIFDELSYDQFHEKADNIYRVVAKVNSYEYAITEAPLAKALMKERPEIISATRVSLNFGEESILSYKNSSYKQLGRQVTPEFFDIFTFPFLNGDFQNALTDPNSIVITESVAKKIFPEENPIGKIINLNNNNDYTVTGIIKDIPGNSHLKFDFLFPFEGNERWGDQSYYTYILLNENASASELFYKINDTYFRSKENITLEEAIRHGFDLNKIGHYLQPLTRIHLHSIYKFDVKGNSNIQYVYIFLIIALVILFIACINFVNLVTARSSTRAKEIGLRKVIGSTRKQLIKQFWSESLALVFIALLVALLFVQLFLPMFNSLSGKHLSMSFTNYRFILCLISVLFITGIVSGSYPALYLSSFKPVDIIKGVTVFGSQRAMLRKILVLIQFVFSIGLIFGTLVISGQLNFMRNAKLGFDKENLVYFTLQNYSTESVETLKRELLQNPNIIGVTSSSELPTGIYNGDSGTKWEGKKEDDKNIQMQVLSVDYDFIDTYQIEMVEGRFFSKTHTTDTRQGVVVNETAVKAMGLQSPVGKGFRHLHTNERIIGVIQDFHYMPLSSAIEPLIVRLNQGEAGCPWLGHGCITVRIKPISSNITDLFEFIEKKLTDKYPNELVEIHFLDERIEKLYVAEKRLNEIVRYFTFLALFVANLGLLGLVSIMTEQRVKEIGIRKVVGASVANILLMLTKDLNKWILLANLIALPMAWYAMNSWLQNFAYRINISILPFLFSGLLALLIAQLTMSWQAIRAALANPAEALRSE